VLPPFIAGELRPTALALVAKIEMRQVSVAAQSCRFRAVEEADVHVLLCPGELREVEDQRLLGRRVGR
jgi:hypothetical protein